MKIPYEVEHVEHALKAFSDEINRLADSEEVRIVMEATGIYHLPILSYLLEQNFLLRLSIL